MAASWELCVDFTFCYRVGVRGRVIIVGCDVAGLAVALFLKRAGYEPIVYDRGRDPRQVPAGLVALTPNGLEVLRTLGLAAAVRVLGQASRRIVLHGQSGERLGEVAGDSLLVGRRDLLGVLRSAACRADVPMEFGVSFTGAESRHHDVLVHFAGRPVTAAHLLLGCDGRWSDVRALVDRDAAPPRFSGVMGCSGFARLPGLDHADGQLHVTFGQYGCFVYQVLTNGDVFWYQTAAAPDPDSRHRPSAVWRARLAELHAGDPAPIADLVRATEWIDRNAIYTTPSLRSWHRGRICLVGFAAHGTGEYSAHGVSMELEDAITLADSLRRNDSVPEAFSGYHRIRHPRAGRVLGQAVGAGLAIAPLDQLGQLVRRIRLPAVVGAAVAETARTYRHRISWDACP
ncbi:FAD-dependent monooxygenase [Amycolatopsis sp. NPDC059021]|uniref:FAD-dependent monooxygenase n=1 Tax=Amycolatopsis sp. NPDC059021 TaxID=3346704 RepID=UPI00366D8EFD